jgi:hypothetical protein
MAKEILCIHSHFIPVFHPSKTPKEFQIEMTFDLLYFISSHVEMGILQIYTTALKTIEENTTKQIAS